MLWFNSLAWATHGLIIRRDMNIFIPNILGFVVATLQLHLFVVYGHSFNSSSTSNSGSGSGPAYSLLFPSAHGEEGNLNKGKSRNDAHQI